MAIYLSNRDGGKTDEQGHYKFQTNAFTGNVLDGGLLVTQNSPLAMNVKVSGGDARIPYSDYAYTAWIPAGSPETVTVTTANPSNPRIDRLVMYVDRGETPSSATANNPTLCKLMLVAGTPAGSPSRPSNGTVDTAVSNNPYIDLADIRVNAGVTQITNANITDTRVLVGAPIADGSVTPIKQSNPYKFLAYVLSGGISVASNGIVPYNQEVFDSNNNFNTSTYKYTVPVTGFYFLKATLYVFSENGQPWISFFKNGSKIHDGIILPVPGSVNIAVEISGLFSLTAGDQIEVRRFASNAAAKNVYGTLGGLETCFSGFLVSRT